MAFGVTLNDKVQVNDIMAVRETAGHLIDGMDGRARAFVQVQNGCDHRCTFCIIPYGRGHSRSVPMGAVVEQVKRLGRQRLSRDRADRRRHHQLMAPTCRAQPSLGKLVQAILQAGAGPAAPAALLDRLDRGRRRTCSTPSPRSRG